MSEFADNIEKNFEETARQINEKLYAAAKLIAEADKLAADANLDGLIHTQWTEITEDMQDDFDKHLDDDDPEPGEIIEGLYEMIDTEALETVIGLAGWNTSSSYC